MINSWKGFFILEFWWTFRASIIKIVFAKNRRNISYNFKYSISVLVLETPYTVGKLSNNSSPTDIPSYSCCHVSKMSVSRAWSIQTSPRHTRVGKELLFYDPTLGHWANDLYMTKVIWLQEVYKKQLIEGRPQIKRFKIDYFLLDFLFWTLYL